MSSLNSKMELPSSQKVFLIWQVMTSDYWSLLTQLCHSCRFQWYSWELTKLGTWTHLSSDSITEWGLSPFPSLLFIALLCFLWLLSHLIPAWFWKSTEVCPAPGWEAQPFTAALGLSTAVSWEHCSWCRSTIHRACPVLTVNTGHGQERGAQCTSWGILFQSQMECVCCLHVFPVSSEWNGLENLSVPRTEGSNKKQEYLCVF